MQMLKKDIVITFLPEEDIIIDLSLGELQL